MRAWVEDFKYQLAMSLRVVGVALAAVAWASVLSSEALPNSDLRSEILVGAALAAVVVAQAFVGLPPSATLVDLLRPYERDILAVARERAHGDLVRTQLLSTRIASLAALRIRSGAEPATDRRAWLRALAHLADS